MKRAIASIMLLSVLSGCNAGLCHVVLDFPDRESFSSWGYRTGDELLVWRDPVIENHLGYVATPPTHLKHAHTPS